MEPLHRAKVELSYTKTLRKKAEEKAERVLADLDRRVQEKEEYLMALQNSGVME